MLYKCPLYHLEVPINIPDSTRPLRKRWTGIITIRLTIRGSQSKDTPCSWSWLVCFKQESFLMNSPRSSRLHRGSVFFRGVPMNHLKALFLSLVVSRYVDFVICLHLHSCMWIGLNDMFEFCYIDRPRLSYFDSTCVIHLIDLEALWRELDVLWVWVELARHFHMCVEQLTRWESPCSMIW